MSDRHELADECRESYSNLKQQLKEANALLDELEHIYSLPELFFEWCMEGNDPRKYKYTMTQEPTKEDMEWAEKEVMEIQNKNKP